MKQSKQLTLDNNDFMIIVKLLLVVNYPGIEAQHSCKPD